MQGCHKIRNSRKIGKSQKKTKKNDKSKVKMGVKKKFDKIQEIRQYFKRHQIFSI